MQFPANSLNFVFSFFFISSKQGVPIFSMYYALFKEQIGDGPGARSLFVKGSTNFTSDFYMNINRLANMEKRMVNTSCFCAFCSGLYTVCQNIINYHDSNIHREILKQLQRFMRLQLRMPCRSRILKYFQTCTLILHNSNMR